MSSDHCRPRPAVSLWSAIAALTLSAAGALTAQPFKASLFLTGTPGDYVEVPNSASLTPATHMTIEFLSHSNNTGCKSLYGKNFTGAGGLWIGNCNNTLRSYINGVLFDGGAIRSDEDTHHIAVTYNGVQRKHYIDGELVGVFNQSGAIVANNSPLRFGSDVSFDDPPVGYIDEVRLWNVARTQGQIQSTMSEAIKTALPGLVSVWSLDGDNGKAGDSVGSNNGGAPHGAATFEFLNHPTFSCTADDTDACFFSNGFRVFSDYQLYTTPFADGHVEITSVGPGHVVPGATSDSSALFWFFSLDNWELLVKGVNGCTLNSEWWVFAAGTTNVHHRIVVIDNLRGDQRIYWSFSGPPAPALNDTSGFSCAPPA